MSSRVAILVPAYKCESMIGETLESIQAQGASLDCVEAVVIADDGSRDRTAEVARALWRSKTPLEILTRRFNCGEYASVNNAAEYLASRGIEWFLIMHADNIAKAGWLEAFLERIGTASDDVGLIGSSYDSFRDGESPKPGENKPGIVKVHGTAEALADTLMMGCWWHISACAIRMETYLRVGGLPKVMQLKGDWDFMLRVLADGWTIEHMPRSFMLYRDNPAGSSSITFRRHMDIWETMTVIGRYHGALGGGKLAALHARHMIFLLRRIGASLVRPNMIRLLWIFPAMGCVFASYWTCVADGAAPPKVAPRPAAAGRQA